MENSKNRIVYADLLRIIATFAVIVLHVSVSKWYESPIREYNWQMFNIYDSLVRWSVPVFVMISGMFFLNPNKEIDFLTGSFKTALNGKPFISAPLISRTTQKLIQIIAVPMYNNDRQIIVE